MSAPFYKFGMFGDEISLVIAFVIGIGFGLFLERAGFGSAKKLTAQFYFRDLAVFKVMFTAIITALLGIFYLSWIGVVDLSLVYFEPTWLVPDIVGGLLLGIGFVVGGYCPGTSVVAVATGKIDGILFMLGLVAGIFGFSEAYASIAGFVNSTAMGTVTIPQTFHLNYGLVVFLVVLLALGGFWGSEKVEQWMARRTAEASR
jgi:hypothetical protein